MSAVAVLEGSSHGFATPLPARPPRVLPARLVLVPTGGQVRALPQPALRLTRAGRLVLTSGVLLVAMVVAFFTLTGGASATSAPQTVTVEQGQTLSQIAAEHMAGVSIATGVAQLELANDLSSSQVQTGQRIVIPAS